MFSFSSRLSLPHLGVLSALWWLTPSSALGQAAPPPLVEADPAAPSAPLGPELAPPAQPPPGGGPAANPGDTDAKGRADDSSLEPLAADSPDKPHKKNKKRKGEGARDGQDARGDRDAYASAFTFGGVGGTMQLKGRVFARTELSHRRETVVSGTGSLEERDRSALDLSLASARFGLEYQSPLRWLSLTLELDVAGRPEVKDAFVLAGKRFFVKAGQFKLPSAAVELESPWTLPLTRRGLVHDLLTDWLDVAGRRPGLALGYRGKGKLKPRLTVGAFQGTTLEEVTPGDRDVELLEQAALNAQTLAARAELSLFGVELGAWYEHRVGSKVVGEFEHYETAGLDATLDHAFERGGLRAWVDGTVGESFYVADDKPGDDETPLFAAARVLVGYRFGGVTLGDPYLEPFGHFALLDPDLEVVSDFVTEAALGINVGYWDRGRLTLQGEMINGQRNLPRGFLDHQDPDRLSLLLQIGARF